MSSTTWTQLIKDIREANPNDLVRGVYYKFDINNRVDSFFVMTDRSVRSYSSDDSSEKWIRDMPITIITESTPTTPTQTDPTPTNPSTTDQQPLPEGEDPDDVISHEVGTDGELKVEMEDEDYDFVFTTRREVMPDVTYGYSMIIYVDKAIHNFSLVSVAVFKANEEDPEKQGTAIAAGYEVSTTGDGTQQIIVKLDDTFQLMDGILLTYRADDYALFGKELGAHILIRNRSGCRSFQNISGYDLKFVCIDVNDARTQAVVKASKIPYGWKLDGDIVYHYTTTETGMVEKTVTVQVYPWKSVTIPYKEEGEITVEHTESIDCEWDDEKKTLTFNGSGLVLDGYAEVTFFNGVDIRIPTRLFFNKGERSYGVLPENYFQVTCSAHEGNKRIYDLEIIPTGWEYKKIYALDSMLGVASGTDRPTAIIDPKKGKLIVTIPVGFSFKIFAVFERSGDNKNFSLLLHHELYARSADFYRDPI